MALVPQRPSNFWGGIGFTLWVGVALPVIAVSMLAVLYGSAHLVITRYTEGWHTATVHLSVVGFWTCYVVLAVSYEKLRARRRSNSH